MAQQKQKKIRDASVGRSNYLTKFFANSNYDIWGFQMSSLAYFYWKNFVKTELAE